MGKAMIAHGLSTKFLPAFLMFAVFLYISDFTRERFLFISPEDFFMGSVIIFTGLIFAYESINQKPKKNSAKGSGFFVILFAFAIINWFIGSIILINLYDPFTDSGDFNLFIQFILVIDLIMFIAQGAYEVKVSKRLVFANHFGGF